MKQIIMAMILVVVFTANVRAASFTVESQNKISGSAFTPSLLGMFATDNTGSVGVYGFAMAMDKWVEAYAGPKFSLATFAEVGIAAGLEQQTTLWRTNGYVWLGSGKISSFTTVEVGGMDYFYHSHVNFQVLKSLGVGAIAQRYAGVGPRVEVSLPWHVGVWGAAVYDPEFKTSGGLVAVRAGF